ncbi:MAG: cardiolipin synthase [Actinomycetaceae bacterium]|nr:cardiolipin synthase [Actinomycetaceae bacterium]
MTSLASTQPRAAVFAWLRLLISGLAIVLQIAFFVAAIVYFSKHLPWLFAVHVALSVVVVIAILASSMAPEYKLAWSIPILLLPLVGGAFYLLYGHRHFSARELTTIHPIWEKSRELRRANTRHVLVDETHPNAPRLEHYLRTSANYPGDPDTEVTYYDSGDKVWKAMLAELENAERYILFQYFIISAGKMWDELHAVLARKAAEGVDVRVLYDDLGSVFTLPKKFESTLREEGIKVQPINPFGLRMTLRYNNRNHAKIMVIDGKVGFTGGVNIGDEYINLDSPYGYWKDTAVRLRGPAVYNLAIMFATVWNAGEDDLDWTQLPADPAAHARTSGKPARPATVDPAVGWVQPYDDSPYSNLRVGEDAYLTLLSNAQHRVDITSPYLIVDAQVTGALKRAARSGLQIRIITPNHGDNWFVHETTRSAYRDLVEAGVQIYEFTPGYMHAKMMIADGESAIIGTINFDYRSLRLHQECAVWLHRVPVIEQMVDGFETTLEKCQPITLEMCQEVSWWRRGIRVVLRTLAPFM